MVDHTGHRTRFIGFFRTSLLKDRTPNSHQFTRTAVGGSSLVMVSIRVGPRSENGCVSKNFHVLFVVVIRAYAN